MEGHTKISILMLIIAAVFNKVMTSNTKEARKVGLLIPEKIIGGVIDIVHSHKYKPTTGQNPPQQTQTSSQQIYQPAPGYQPQYPNYQYPPSQNQGTYQSQYQSQFQNGYNTGYQPPNGGNYPTNYPPSYPQNSGPVYQGPIQQPSYPPQGQNQYQGSYNQGNQYQNQNQQSSGQYQNHNQQQTSGQYNQNQQTGQYQNTNQQGTGQYQGNNQNQHNNQGSNQQTGGQFIAQGSGGQGGGFQISAGQQSGGPGPTCVCQAWTKPDGATVNDVQQKGQEKSEESMPE